MAEGSLYRREGGREGFCASEALRVMATCPLRLPKKLKLLTSHYVTSLTTNGVLHYTTVQRGSDVGESVRSIVLV